MPGELETMGSMAINDLKVKFLELVRRRGRIILLTNPGSGMGNQFYYWLRAHTLQIQGHEAFAMWAPKMLPIEDKFVYCRDRLTIKRADVSFFDQRMPGLPQAFGKDFSRVELENFIRECLCPPGSPLLVELEKAEALATPGRVLVNVRRGDYYSVPKHRGEYSFDIGEYVRVALDELRSTGEIREICVISDDLDWCRQKMQWLNDVAPVTYPEADLGVLEQLALLATGERIVLANSSFSYWAAYIGEVWKQEQGVRGWNTNVVAPAFHSRWAANPAPQLDPAWVTIHDIPGGWDG